jgi:hypothetical protein
MTSGQCHQSLYEKTPVFIPQWQKERIFTIQDLKNGIVQLINRF